MLQDSVRRYLEDNADLEQLRGYVEGDAALAQKLHRGLLDLGVHLTLLPEAHGGLGMGILEAALIQQMLGRYVAPSGFAAAYALAVVGLEAATPEQQADWLGRIANGEVVMGVGLTEATGAREQSGLILTGEKAAGRASFVMTSENATHFMLTAGDDLLIVARDDKTISQSAL
ncbi:MAG: acyl-CoA dehydrogenase family protein, partial [Gammaproteobacteria bacterium]